MNLLQELEEIAIKTVHDKLSFGKGIKYDPNKTLNQRDASDLIQQAHDNAEEVDTVAFGLELNDGEIVKVYVAADQGEAFEKAMSELLGKEDDIEEAIEQLANEFDIVSVEWPEQRGEVNQQGQPVEKPEEETTDAEGGEAPKESKIKLNFKLNKAKDEDADEKKDDKEEKKDGEEEAPKGDDLEGDADLDIGSSEEETGGEEESSGEEEEDSGEEESSGEDKGGKKKKKTKKKEEKPALGESVNSRWPFETFLGEAHQDKELKIEDIFKTSLQRKIVKLILHLDMPVERLLQKKSQLRHGVREASLVLMSSSRGRTLLNKINAEFDAHSDISAHSAKEKEFAKNHSDEDLDEQVDAHAKQISVLVETLLHLLEKLGVPKSVIDTRKISLKQHLRHTAKVIAAHAKLRNYIHLLVEVLSPSSHHKKDEELNEEVVLGTETYLKIISTVLSSLGIPDENINFQKGKLIQSLRNRNEVLNNTVVRSRLIALAKALSQVESTVTNEELVIEGPEKHRENALKLGEWNISKIDKRCQLQIENIKLDLDERNTSELVKSIDNGFEVMVKSGSKYFDFKPIGHGYEYAVFLMDSHKDIDTTKYENGILFPKKSVETLLNLF